MLSNAPKAAYLHIPFCRRRCFYCDFPISVVGNRLRGETSHTIAHYVQQLCQEIIATPALGEPLSTVFFGGGTPSLLSIEQLSQILDTLARQFGLEQGVEISIEMDPGTFDRPLLQGYRAAGITRVSLGVQAFADQFLEACGRFHCLSDVYRAIDDVQALAIPSWSLDLISGLPGQTLADWERGLEVAIATAPPHLSVYDLTIEPQTPFGRYYQAGISPAGISPLPSEATTVAQYRQAQTFLTQAGYRHYEISNYARPGHQCQHNRVYWQNQSYYGFGMGATSYTQAQRFSRPRTLKAYDAWLESYITNDGQIDCDRTSPQENCLDGIMVGLRLQEGIALAPIVHLFGEAAITTLQTRLYPYIQAGQVLVTGNDIDSMRLKLTDPDGFLISNTIIVEIFNVLESGVEPCEVIR
jgi:putative oxygen-independent coproporphyrinogen III oxidase